MRQTDTRSINGIEVVIESGIEVDREINAPEVVSITADENYSFYRHSGVKPRVQRRPRPKWARRWARTWNKRYGKMPVCGILLGAALVAIGIAIGGAVVSKQFSQDRQYRQSGKNPTASQTPFPSTEGSSTVRSQPSKLPPSTAVATVTMSSELPGSTASQTDSATLSISVPADASPSELDATSTTRGTTSQELSLALTTPSPLSTDEDPSSQTFASATGTDTITRSVSSEGLLGGVTSIIGGLRTNLTPTTTP